MDLRRLRVGEYVTAASGVALLVSLFGPWYGRPDGTLTAWQALGALDVLLAFVAAAGVLLALVTATQRVPAVPVALSVFVGFAGVLGVVLVLVRLADLPTGADGRDWALWLGLASAGGIVAGAWLAMRDERPSRPGRPTDVSGRPAPPPPEIEPIAAPGPE